MATDETQRTEPLPSLPAANGESPLRATGVKIASSESFTFEEVGQFLRAQAATLVALLGDRDSGKSTLICSIYDRFLHGSFAGCESSGIRTITGFERRAHLERLDSGRGTPDTQHTSIAEGLQYFHFPLVHVETGGRYELLVSDRAGELYKDARGNSTLVKELIEVPQADFVVILLDGARLASPILRAGAFFAVRQTLQMLTDQNALRATDRVQVVVSKIDLIEGVAETPDVRRHLAEFQERLARDFGSKFAHLQFLEIAARDPKGTYPAAHGVGLLLQSWLKGPKVRTLMTAEPVPLVTEFDKLSLRPGANEGRDS
jgi:hypothetical protein